MQAAWLKPAVRGAVFGAVATMITGFWLLGWTLGSTAEKMAQGRAESAVVAALTPVSVADFKEEPDAAAKLDELKKIGSWQQGTFIEKGGGATLPGNRAPDSAVARACAEALTKA